MWALIGVDTFIYLLLCLSNPGIPPQIINACKARVRPDRQVPSGEAAGEGALLPVSTRNRICGECQVKFSIESEFVYTQVATEHCHDCGVCVLKVDHHCGFFDRCIAKGNVKLFYSMLILFFGSMGLLFVLLLIDIGNN